MFDYKPTMSGVNWCEATTGVQPKPVSLKNNYEHCYLENTFKFTISLFWSTTLPVVWHDMSTLVPVWSGGHAESAPSVQA